MTKRDGETQLERVNVMLSVSEQEWLGTLAAEIHTTTGAKVSRSEIVRAALATLRELHRAMPACPTRFVPLSTCKSGVELAQMGVLAIRRATAQ